MGWVIVLLVYIVWIPVAVGVFSAHDKSVRGFDSLDVLLGFVWPIAAFVYGAGRLSENIYLIIKRISAWLYEIGRRIGRRIA